MEIRGRVDAVQLASLEDRVEPRRDLSATARFRAVVILATDDRATDRALGRVVVERDAGVVDEARKPIPDANRVRRRFADRERRDLRLRPQPRPELVEDRRCLRAATQPCVRAASPDEKPPAVLACTAG
jgi:hypothetical protein